MGEKTALWTPFCPTLWRAELGLREINHRQPQTTFRDHGAGPQGCHRGPKAASPKLRQVPTHAVPRTEPAPSRRCSPEELADLPAVGLEGDVPHQDLGAGLLSGNLLLPSGCQGWPGGREGPVTWGSVAAAFH